MMKTELFSWLRRLRKDTYGVTKDLSPEELITYYREKAEEARKKVAKHRKSPGDGDRLAGYKRIHWSAVLL